MPNNLLEHLSMLTGIARNLILGSTVMLALITFLLRDKRFGASKQSILWCLWFASAFYHQFGRLIGRKPSSTVIS